ncbi:redoxin family protein [Nocardioides sp.]|uniref:redoxin family protein n=1 Tax=Nocardioides sp. TaxID=35761 RepID=UPI003561DBF6
MTHRTHRRASTLISLALGAALLLGACSSAGSDPADSDAGSGSGSGGGVSVADGPTADLDFTAQTVDGDSFDGGQLAGKPTVLWFWAPWCSTCRAQSSAVSALAETYDGRVNVVGVGGLADSSAIVDYAREVTAPTQLIDPDGAVWRHFGVRAQSSYVVIDADGTVVRDGYLDDRVLADLVDELVA